MVYNCYAVTITNLKHFETEAGSGSGESEINKLDKNIKLIEKEDIKVFTKVYNILLKELRKERLETSFQEKVFI